MSVCDLVSGVGLSDAFPNREMRGQANNQRSFCGNCRVKTTLQPRMRFLGFKMHLRSGLQFDRLSW